MTAKVTMKPNWSVNIQKQLKIGLLEMTTDVRRRAIMLAPIDTGDLLASGIIETITDGYSVRFGSSSVPYARRRHFENKKTPGAIGYLSKPGESVGRSDKAKYFRGKI